MLFTKEKGKFIINKNFVNKIISASGAAFEKSGLNKSGLTGSSGSTFSDFLEKAKPHVLQSCRICGHPDTETIKRFDYRTYRRCKKCSMISMDRMNDPPFQYDKDYFFDLYKKQYGKTYLDDFPALLDAGKRRINTIKSILKNYFGKNNPAYKVLDIGCAYGPFLKAAKEAGFSPQGIEPIEDAAEYVRKELEIPCITGFFPPENLKDEQYDLVSLWYVIEHFENPKKILEEIYRILKKGGILAFSTPSFSGISGIKSISAFLEKSPEDHFTVLNPLYCKKLLKRFGFSAKKIVVTGHHPERFPVAGKYVKQNSFLYNIIMLASKILKLGDSFEIYAVKK